MLVEQVGESSLELQHLVLVVLIHFERMREVEIRLHEPGRTTVKRSADRYRAGRRILGDISPLASTEDIHSLERNRVAQSHVRKRAQRRALIRALEQTEGRSHALPG